MTLRIHLWSYTVKLMLALLLSRLAKRARQADISSQVDEDDDASDDSDVI